MEPTPAPAAPGPLMPTLSTTVLLAMAAIGVVVLAAIFGFILFIANLRIDERLWWTGLASMIFAFAFYLMFAATHDRKLATPRGWILCDRRGQLLRLDLHGRGGRRRKVALPDPVVRPGGHRPRRDLRDGTGRGARCDPEGAPPPHPVRSVSGPAPSPRLTVQS